MPVEEITVQTLDELLERSAATENFKKAVRQLEAGRVDLPIHDAGGSPPVKLLRLIMKLLEEYPELPFEQLQVKAGSGCSDYTGTAVAQPGDVRFKFEWNCAWRAKQLGWRDAFGDPDQIRAARTYGYQCFRRLEKIG